MHLRCLESIVSQEALPARTACRLRQAAEGPKVADGTLLRTENNLYFAR